MKNNSDPFWRLLASWGLVAVAMYLMTRYGHYGLILAIPLLAIGQNMRIEQDREMYQRFVKTGGWMVLALLYYVALLVYVVIAVTKGVRLEELPIVVFIVMIMFPILCGMIINDIRTCLGGTVDRNADRR